MEETNKIYYSLKETCEITGLPSSTLHFWEKSFPNLSPRKDGHNNRYYTSTDIELIKRIKYIRDELQITRIEAIKKELSNNSKDSDAKQRATEILLRVRKELSDIRSNIR